MRLVTVNLYNGRVVPADLVRFLDRFRPELVAAQEVGPDAARILADRFRYGLVEGGLLHEGRALVGSVPITVTPLDLPFRGGYRGVVELEGAPVEVLSVHMANPIDGLGFKGIPIRRSQLADLDALLERGADRVLVGDLNATPIWRTYRRLRRHLDDGVETWARGAGTRPRPTWSKKPGWPALLRIDHVLTSGVQLRDVAVEAIAGLDHRAVVVELSRPAA